MDKAAWAEESDDRVSWKLTRNSATGNDQSQVKLVIKLEITHGERPLKSHEPETKPEVKSEPTDKAKPTPEPTSTLGKAPDIDVRHSTSGVPCHTDGIAGAPKWTSNRHKFDLDNISGFIPWFSHGIKY